MRIIRLVLVNVVVIALLIIVAAMLPSAPATADTGGIIKPVKQQMLISDTTYMMTETGQVLTTPAAYIGDFGAVQYQVKVEVEDDEILGPHVITWTPQFSIQPIPSGSNCDAVTDWFDGVVYQAVQDDLYVTPQFIWEQNPMSARTVGSEIIGFEAAALGSCARVRIEIDAAAVPITATINIRAINRQ